MSVSDVLTQAGFLTITCVLQSSFQTLVSLLGILGQRSVVQAAVAHKAHGPSSLLAASAAPAPQPELMSPARACNGAHTGSWLLPGSQNGCHSLGHDCIGPVGAQMGSDLPNGNCFKNWLVKSGDTSKGSLSYMHLGVQELQPGHHPAGMASALCKLTRGCMWHRNVSGWTGLGRDHQV